MCRFCKRMLMPTPDGTGWECVSCKPKHWPTMPALEVEIKEPEKTPLQEEIKEAA